MIRFGLFVLVALSGCEAKPDLLMDVCQVNVDCTLVQLDECCARSECDSDLRAETQARTRFRIDACAKKDCEKSAKVCKDSHTKVGSFCREGKCVVEAI